MEELCADWQTAFRRVWTILSRTTRTMTIFPAAPPRYENDQRIDFVNKYRVIPASLSN
jgi:hypothetical protein